MSASVGTALVTCPGCGESFALPVCLLSVTVSYGSLIVSFREVAEIHTCKGRET